MCSEGGKETPWSLAAPRNRGLWRGKAGCTHAQGGVAHQTPSSVMAAFIITFSWMKLLTQEKGPPEPQERSRSSGDGPGGAGRMLPAPFHFSSNFCPQGSSDHASESLSAFATPLTRSGTPAPPLLLRWQGELSIAGFTRKRGFIFLIISNGCGSALTADNYSLPFILRSQIAH